MPKGKKQKVSETSINRLQAELEKQRSAFPKRMVELANEGADINLIAKAIALIPSKWKNRSGTYDMTLDLSRVDLGKEKAIRNAFTLLTKGLDAVFPNTNTGKILHKEVMQNFLKQKDLLDLYLYYKRLESYSEALRKSLPYSADDDDANAELYVLTQIYPKERIREMKKKKIMPASQSMHGLWDESIVTIVDELRRIGYSRNKSYAKTAQLLSLYYPDIYRDDDLNLVRQRYTYRKAK